ncbi:MAG: hypothetical protein FJX23_08190 [Alphaproteobacteria bacterium]|nr:hypothetical protein [Alphaproteobacteria bacterium]
MHILKEEKSPVYALLGLLAVVLYCAPYILMGQDAYVTIHDYLDSSFVRVKVLAESGQLFAASSAIIPQYDVPRISLRSEFHLPVWLDLVFRPYTGFVILQLFMRSVAFIGMFLLLRRHVIPSDAAIAAAVALCYAFLPFWPAGVLSVAGLPLVMYGVLNIRDSGGRWVDWFIVCLFPFFSSLVTTGLFLLCILGGLGLFDWVKQRRLNGRYVLALGLLSASYMVVEYRLLLNAFFAPAFTAHRVEISPEFISFSQGLKLAWKNFLYGHYHAHSLQTWSILPAAPIALILAVCQREKLEGDGWKLAGLIALCAIISLLFGLWNSTIFEGIRNQLPLFKNFNFARFHWLHPLFWTVVFGLALSMIHRGFSKQRVGQGLVLLALLLQFTLLIQNHPYLTAKAKPGITYRQFFAEELFERIKRDIGKPLPDYRVVSLGLHPSIAAYNGMYTADWYLTYYPLEKKERFRQVIAAELEKNPNLKHYYDEWGNRMYLFSDALGRDFIGKVKDPIDAPEFDYGRLREMGVAFIISRVEVRGLQLLGHYTDDKSFWDLYVYRVEK